MRENINKIFKNELKQQNSIQNTKNRAKNKITARKIGMMPSKFFAIKLQRLKFQPCGILRFKISALREKMCGF